MSTYSNLKIEEITLGDSGWGTSTTNNLLAVQQALQSATLATGDFTANVATLPWTNTSSTTNTPRAMVLNITATLSGAGTVNLPAITGGKPYLVFNNSIGGYAVTVKVTGLTGVSVPNGKSMWLWNNGTDIVDGTNYISSLSLGTDLAVADGGTGASTASGARTNLGASTLGSNLFTITNPSAVTFPQFNADNTVSSLDATAFRTAIGAGSGTGTVTGVTATSPVASSGGTAPVISLNANYGDTLNPYASKTANYVLAAPNGSSGAPTFRAIVAADIPTLNQNTSGTAAGLSTTLAVASGGTGQTSANAAFNALAPSQASASGKYLKSNGTDTAWDQIDISTADITGTLPVANGGTGVTTSTGTGAVVLSTSPSLVTPALGTPTSGNFSTGTFTWPTFNQNTSGTAAGLSVTLAVGSGGTGVTTSTGSGSNVLSTSPTLVTPILGTPQSGNFSTGTFTWPTFNQNTTGTAAGLSATLGIGSGGTGATTAGTARTSLGLGSISTQDASAVAITGGSVSGTTVTQRVVVIADATSVTINADTTDIATQANTQSAGTLTINAPTGTPVNGQKLVFRLRSTNAQTFSWNAVFAGSTDLSLPTTSSGSSKYDYVGFMYNSTAAKWQLLAKNFGF